MIRILDRHVAWEFTRIFLLFALTAPLMFILFDVTDRLDRYLGRGIRPADVALSYVYQYPQFVLWALPVATLIATVFTINGMSRHSELTAAKAGGISFYRVMAPLPLLGIVFTLVGLGLSELVPVTNRKRAELLGEVRRTPQARTDFVYRAEDGRVYMIRRLDVAQAEIHGISMERRGDEPRIPSIHAAAELGTYARDEGWTLYSGYLRYLTGPGKEHTMRFDRMRPLGFTEPPDHLQARAKDPEEMRYAELGRFIEVLERSGSRPLKLKVERAQKIALPVATFIIILFAAPLAATTQRGGTAYGIGVSLAITIVYLMLFRVAGAAGATGALSPLLAAWLPNLVFAAGGLVLLARVKT
ncbi:MAG TPA: LptF/LptG family permease [Longimicrobiales bacterium]|nr:LptF/LptG family permease [Longimicrobiales bacterium]